MAFASGILGMLQVEAKAVSWSHFRNPRWNTASATARLSFSSMNVCGTHSKEETKLASSLVNPSGVLAL